MGTGLKNSDPWAAILSVLMTVFVCHDVMWVGTIHVPEVFVPMLSFSMV